MHAKACKKVFGHTKIIPAKRYHSESTILKETIVLAREKEPLKCDPIVFWK